MEEADRTEDQCGDIDSTCHVHKKHGQMGMIAACPPIKRRSPSFFFLLISERSNTPDD